MTTNYDAASLVAKFVSWMLFKFRMTTNYGAASLVAKFVSSKTPDTERQTDKQHGTLKPNSVNAVRLKNLFFKSC